MLTTTLSHVEWVGGPVPNLPGFHFDKLSVASPVEPPLKACANDGLQIVNNLGAASWGELTSTRLKNKLDATERINSEF